MREKLPSSLKIKCSLFPSFKNNLSQEKLYTFTVLTLAIAAIFNMSIYIMWSDHFILKNLWAISLGVGIISFLSLIYQKPEYVNFQSWYLMIPLLLFILKISVTRDYEGNFPLKYLALFSLFSLVSISSKMIIVDIYQQYKRILSFILLISSVFYFLVILGIIDKSSFHEIQHVNTLKQKYLSYYFIVMEKTYIYSMENGILFTRFNSIFDEPGVIGTICALILVGERFNFKDKKNIIFLTAGYLSLSLFFVILVTPLLLIKYRKKIIFLGISFLMIILLLNYFFLDLRDFLYNYTFARFLCSTDTPGSALSRDPPEIREVFNHFSSMDFFTQFWGLGHNALEKIAPGSSIYKVLIINYGYLGFFLLLFHLFVHYIGVIQSLQKKITLSLEQKALFSLIFLFHLLNIYQRPNIWSFTFTLIYLGPLYKFLFDILNSSQKDNKIITEPSLNKIKSCETLIK